MEEPRDDLNVEISNLDDEPRAVPAQHKRVKWERAITERFTFTARFSRRQRLLQAVVTSICVLLLMGIFLSSIASVRAVVSRTISPFLPGASSTTLVGVNTFYVDGTPSWGQLFIDGQRIKHLPRIREDTPLQLSPGQHHLIWQAAPFRPQACVVSIPVNLAKDTCSYNKTVQDTHGYSVWLLTFSVSLALLPPQQRLNLTQSIQQALDQQPSMSIVHPQELYAITTSYAVKMYTLGENVQKATQPMMATVNFQIDTDTSMPVQCTDNVFGQFSSYSCAFDGQDCHLLCSMPDFIQTLAFPRSDWVALAVVRVSWTYATFNGQFVASNQPDRADIMVPDAYLLPLSISWQHDAWVVHTSFVDPNLNLDSAAQPACLSAQADFMQGNELAIAIPGNVGYTVAYHSLAPSDGCLVTVMLQPTSSGTAPVAKPSYAYSLQRFGVFVAMNATAHKLWPDMPMADQYEIAFMQHLIQTYQPQPFSSATNVWPGLP